MTTSNEQASDAACGAAWWQAGVVFAAFVAGSTVAAAADGEGDLGSKAASALGLAAANWVLAWVAVKLMPGEWSEWPASSKTNRALVMGISSVVAGFALLWFVMGYAGVADDRFASGLRMAAKGALGCLLGVVPGLILMSRYHDRAHPMLVGAAFVAMAFIGLALGGAGGELFTSAWWRTHAVGLFREAILGAAFGAFLAWHHLRSAPVQAG